MIFNMKIDDDAIEEKTSNKKFSTEIKEFCSFFESKDDFKNNNFIKYSIHTIGLYIIGRFFYPTICFKDPTFFSYKSATLTSDQKFTIEFNNLLKPKNVEEMMEDVYKRQSLENVISFKNKRRVFAKQNE